MLLDQRVVTNYIFCPQCTDCMKHGLNKIKMLTNIINTMHTAHVHYYTIISIWNNVFKITYPTLKISKYYFQKMFYLLTWPNLIEFKQK